MLKALRVEMNVASFYANQTDLKQCVAGIQNGGAKTPRAEVLLCNFTYNECTREKGCIRDGAVSTRHWLPMVLARESDNKLLWRFEDIVFTTCGVDILFDAYICSKKHIITNLYCTLLSLSSYFKTYNYFVVIGKNYLRVLTYVLCIVKLVPNR